MCRKADNADGLVAGFYFVCNPEKLSRVAREPTLSR